MFMRGLYIYFRHLRKKNMPCDKIVKLLKERYPKEMDEVISDTGHSPADIPSTYVADVYYALERDADLDSDMCALERVNRNDAEYREFCVWKACLPVGVYERLQSVQSFKDIKSMIVDESNTAEWRETLMSCLRGRCTIPEKMSSNLLATFLDDDTSVSSLSLVVSAYVNHQEDWEKFTTPLYGKEAVLRLSGDIRDALSGRLSYEDLLLRNYSLREMGLRVSVLQNELEGFDVAV